MTDKTLFFIGVAIFSIIWTTLCVIYGKKSTEKYLAWEEEMEHKLSSCPAIELANDLIKDKPGAIENAKIYLKKIPWNESFAHPAPIPANPDSTTH